MEDKRKHRRIQEQIKVDYRIITLGDKPHKNLEFSGWADMEDISEGGIKFEYHEAIPVGSMIEITFYTQESLKNAIILKGKVMRVEESLHVKGYFEMGIQFLEAFSKDKEMLMKHIELMKKKEPSQ
jgi:hypothetical protein